MVWVACAALHIFALAVTLAAAAAPAPAAAAAALHASLFASTNSASAPNAAGRTLSP